ncbi:MAG: ATP-dependent DNA ligase [Nanoarchaeota archaeon]
MKYLDIANVFEALSETSSRLDKTDILADFLTTIPETDSHEALLLLQGRAFPEWDTRHIGVAGKLIIKAVAQATGRDASEIETEFHRKGDLGIVIEQLLSTRRQQTLFSRPLTVKDVLDTLQELAGVSGSSSQDHKLATLNRLLTNAQPIEAKFIVRTVLEDLRVGVAQGTLRDAIVKAYFEGENKEKAKERVKRALDLTTDVGRVVKHIKEGKRLEDISLTVGTPCKVMLARKEKSFDDAFARTGFPVRIEYKYDGFRLQIHKDENTIRLFTRRLEEVTTQFPDVVKAVRDHVSSHSCILDTEVVGYDPRERIYKPFQYISQRIRRKYDIDKLVSELPVEVNVFDILHSEGNDHIDESLDKRLDILNQIITPHKRVLVLAKGETVDTIEEAESIYQKSLSAGNEGVMIKDLEKPYEPGGRVSAWIKMKPVMEELDLVIVKARWGEGKRSEWMTSFTLACRDGDEFLPVGKVGTGMKEEATGQGLSFPELTEKLKPIVTATSGKEVEVKPEVVVTIAYEEIQKSTAYRAGYALRFPRTIAYRPDRNAEDIASKDEIIDLYEEQ